MTIPTREQLLALDYTYAGLPLARVLAKEMTDPDHTYAGLPFLVFGAGEGGGEPPPPSPHPPTYMALALSSPPNTATTIGRETGDVLLADGGFTLKEEDETLPSASATIELFQTSTPTGGTWVLGTDYRTNAATDGVLRSPLPSDNPGDESATLTVVTTAPLTRISFEWGVRGMNFADVALNDALRFYVDDVELLTAFPVEDGGDLIDLATGAFSFVRPPGTYSLRWRWHRQSIYSWYPDESHAWITALIIDPNF